MTDGNTRNDRRGKFRCVSPGDGQFAVLRLGRREYTARLVDQSAEGFAVALGNLPRKSKLRNLGQRFLLRTSRGWSEVEVARHGHDEDDDETILGLREVRELPDPREPMGRRGPALFTRPIRGGPATRLGSWVTFGLGGVLMFWLYIAYSIYRS